MGALDRTLIFVSVFCVVLGLWILLGILIPAVKARRSKKTNKPIGYITRIYNNDNGVYVEGYLNGQFGDHKITDESTLSIGFNPVVSVKEGNIRTITEARIHSVSLDSEPGPYGGKIEIVED